MITSETAGCKAGRIPLKEEGKEGGDEEREQAERTKRGKEGGKRIPRL